MNDLERTDLASPFLVLVQLREDGSQEPGGGVYSGRSGWFQCSQSQVGLLAPQFGS